MQLLHKRCGLGRGAHTFRLCARVSQCDQLGRAAQNSAPAPVRSPGRAQTWKQRNRKPETQRDFRKKRRPFSEHSPVVRVSGGPLFGSVFRTPFFRGRSEGHRKRGLRPSRFHGQALAGFEEAAARIPAPRPPSNPLIPASQCSRVCGWRRGVSLGRVRRCDVLSRDCRVGGRQAFLDILLASPSKQVPFPAKGGPSSRLANRGWTQGGVNLHGHQRVQTTQAPCHKGD